MLKNKIEMFLAHPRQKPGIFVLIYEHFLQI